MEDHPRVLQQRVEIPSVQGGGQQTIEGIGGEDHEGEKAQADQAHHPQHAGCHGQGQAA